MRRPTLGQKLRAIVLAMPFAGAVACDCDHLPSIDSGYAVGSGYAVDSGSAADSGYAVDSGYPIDAGCWPDGGYVCPAGYQGQVELLPRGFDGGSCFQACSEIPLGSSSTSTCAFTTLDCDPAVLCCGVPTKGRRPPGLQDSTAARSPNAVGAFFAEAARLEAASVAAFRLLARELSAHGAPRALVRAARTAAVDEVRHTRAAAALARRYGAEPTAAVVGRLPRGRSLAAVAIENAVEGCVRETYGALCALWQARTARDPVIAAAMAPIADDETRHAELAWRVAAWAAPNLDRTARRRMAAGRARAFAELRAEATRPLAATQVALAGLPSPATATRLLTALGPHLPRDLGVPRDSVE